MDPVGGATLLKEDPCGALDAVDKGIDEGPPEDAPDRPPGGGNPGG